MAGELLHRGPDGVGLYLADGFGMVATRLAVVDLERGDQPLPTRTEVVGDAERRDLQPPRASPRARGARPPLRDALRHRGDRPRVRGVGPRLPLAAERRFRARGLGRREARALPGARPLRRPTALPAGARGSARFASEAKALLRHPDARRELDPSALVETFTAWSISPSRSAFTGIRELAPAHYLLLREDGERVEKRWWDLDFTTADPAPSLDDAAEELHALLDDAIGSGCAPTFRSPRISAAASTPRPSSRWRGGTCRRRSPCSGSASSRRSSTRRRTRAASRRLRPGRRRRRGRRRGRRGALPRAVALAERPMLRTALVPLLALSRGVHEAGIKVVLTGEGADELFAGYDVFREDKIRRFWARDPESAWRPLLIERLYPYLPRPLAPSRLLRQFFAQRLEETGDPLYSHFFGSRTRPAACGCWTRTSPRRARRRSWRSCATVSRSTSRPSRRSAGRSTSRSRRSSPATSCTRRETGC